MSRVASALTALGLTTALVVSSQTTSTAADAVTYVADGVSVVVTADPFSLRVLDEEGADVLAQHPGLGTSAAGTVGFQTTTAAGTRRHRGVGPVLPGEQFGELDARPSVGWFHATSAASLALVDGALVAELITNDPAARRVALTVTAGGEGSVRVVAEVLGETLDVEAVGMGFVAGPEERFLGFGERNDEAGRTTGIVEHYVGEGPYQREEYPFLQPAIIPAWGARQRPDATYFPIPWLLSDAGHGVLVNDDFVSLHRLRTDANDAWSVEVLATSMDLTIHTGPTPLDALGRLVRDLGHQPTPEPWFYGPWFQPMTNFTVDLDTQLAQVKALRDADAPVSAVEMTHRYLPCGQHRGSQEEIRTRTDAMHERGLAILGYLNPLVCRSYTEVHEEAVATGAFQRRANGDPYEFNSYVGAQDVPVELVAHLDLSTEAGARIFSGEIGKLLGDGGDGWMEDFGEYTPFDAVSGDGTTGDELHNRFARDYHCAAYEDTVARDITPGRFVRSGWTGSAACSPMVWSGDPTVGWGFDGLASQVTSALSAGTSGISMWSTDTGGFFALGTNALSEELLGRWVDFSALTPTLRTRVDGVAIPAKDRPQIFEEPVLSTFRQAASLHQQLLPYLQAATATYEATGRPIMAHHALTDSGDAVLRVLDDQYRLGPDLLVAPVTTEGATTRDLVLPAGDWVELGTSTTFDADGRGGIDLTSPVLHAAGATTVDAPIGRPPVFVRRGTLLPLLSRDVDTTAPVAAGDDLVTAAAREDVRELLAWPQGVGSASFGDADERLTSVEQDGSWSVTVDQTKVRTWSVQVAMSTLEAPFTPCSWSVDGTTLPTEAWSYDETTGVTIAQVRMSTNSTATVSRCADAATDPVPDSDPDSGTDGALPVTGGASMTAGALALLVGLARRRRRP